MQIAGIQKSTLLDYPEKIACAVFTQGCNMRCPYCHNPELLDCNREDILLNERDLYAFLQTRKGFLDGVCITGGEPTLQADLEDVASTIKDMGFLVKIDTNGTNPNAVEDLIRKFLVDYIAMDVKTSLSGYRGTLGFGGNTEKINKSIEIIKDSGVDYEFRTTVVPGLVDKDELTAIAEMIHGAKTFFIQNFRPGDVLDDSLAETKGFPVSMLEAFREFMEKHVQHVNIRN